jgi:CheY-like chemotaxis protein
MQRFIMMLEDDPDDRFLTRNVMEALGLSIPVQFYTDSNDLLQALNHTDLPALILLDYNSTPENAVAVCRRLKQDAATKEIPVIILSESELKEYKEAAYAAGANSFITKPSSMEETQRKIAGFFHYWLDVAVV